MAAISAGCDGGAVAPHCARRSSLMRALSMCSRVGALRATPVTRARFIAIVAPAGERTRRHTQHGTTGWPGTPRAPCHTLLEHGGDENGTTRAMTNNANGIHNRQVHTIMVLIMHAKRLRLTGAETGSETGSPSAAPHFPTACIPPAAPRFLPFPSPAIRISLTLLAPGSLPVPRNIGAANGKPPVDTTARANVDTASASLSVVDLEGSKISEGDVVVLILPDGMAPLSSTPRGKATYEREAMTVGIHTTARSSLTAGFGMVSRSLNPGGSTHHEGETMPLAPHPHPPLLTPRGVRIVLILRHGISSSPASCRSSCPLSFHASLVIRHGQCSSSPAPCLSSCPSPSHPPALLPPPTSPVECARAEAYRRWRCPLGGGAASLQVPERAIRGPMLDASTAPPHGGGGSSCRAPTGREVAVTPSNGQPAEVAVQEVEAAPATGSVGEPPASAESVAVRPSSDVTTSRPHGP